MRARSCLSAALEVIPYEAKDWCYRGRIYLELEQTDEAFSAFEESYNKGYAQAGYYLGYCYELQGKSEEAINLYQEQIKHDHRMPGFTISFHRALFVRENIRMR